jgi:hypothetical protein
LDRIIVTFDEFMTAAQFGQVLGECDGIIKKLICICAPPIPSYFAAYKDIIPEQKSVALLMIAQPSLEPFQELVKEFNGKICYQKLAQESNKRTPILELTWNHTTLHARSADANLTYLQTLFPDDPELKLVEHCYDHFWRRSDDAFRICKTARKTTSNWFTDLSSLPLKSVSMKLFAITKNKGQLSLILIPIF